MRASGLTRRHAFWMVCACLLLLPRFAGAAESSAAVDLDGDGQRDQFVVERNEPSVLRIWLSASNTTQVIRTGVALRQVIAADLDGDHRPELIARDSDSKLHVWTHKGQGFRSYRLRHPLRGTLLHSNRRSIEDHNSQPSDGIVTGAFAPLALILCASSRAPGMEGAAQCTLHAGVGRRSLTAVAPFAPRPPPTDLPS